MDPQNPAHNTHNSTLPSQFGNSVYCVDDSERVKKLLAELRALGVALSIDSGQLGFDAPAGVMTTDRLARLRADRDAVVAALESIEQPVEPVTERQLDTRGSVVHCKRSAFDVYIGRPSKWGNPFVIGRDGDRAGVIKKYREWIVKQPELMAAMGELRGKKLGCFCAPSACHGDVLAELAAKSEPDEMPPGIHCPFCQCRRFTDEKKGMRCKSCGRLAWLFLPNGSAVRADCEKLDLRFDV